MDSNMKNGVINSEWIWKGHIEYQWCQWLWKTIQSLQGEKNYPCKKTKEKYQQEKVYKRRFFEILLRIYNIMCNLYTA